MIIDTTIDQWQWLIPATLVILAVLQAVYLLWLRQSVRRWSRYTRPSEPIMPNRPQAGGRPSSRPNESPPAQPTMTSGLGKFVIKAGLRNVSEITLPGNHFTIGRFLNQEDNVLVALDETSVSRKHAHFKVDEGVREYYIQDANSTYGTFLNKNGQFERLSSGQDERVYNEDVVQFGNNVQVRLVLPCATRADVERS